MKRLFFAIWPDDASRRQLDELNHRIELPGRKLIPDNLHITLVFLGNVDDQTAMAVQQRAAKIKARPFTLIFDELDFWRRPRVLCLTCRRQPKEIYALVNALTEMVEAFPVNLDKRAYRAHVTLARKAQQRPDIDFEPVRIEASRFALVQSVSTERGVRYYVLDSWPLVRD